VLTTYMYVPCELDVLMIHFLQQMHDAEVCGLKKSGKDLFYRWSFLKQARTEQVPTLHKVRPGRMYGDWTCWSVHLTKIPHS
jgi:hypothetical protein